MASRTDGKMSKDVAENTDADSENDEVEKDNANQTSMWLRIGALVVFVFGVGLIVYGIYFDSPKSDASMAKMHAQRAVLTGTALTVKPLDEARTFEYATLPNGVEVVTIHDRHALKKSFAAAVKAGSFDDPKALPGLAHFCEHMVFLGTEKYKDSNGFDSFVAAHGGASNAMTSDETTVYFADVSQDAAEEGLDRFADFFKAPTFAAEYVHKEVNAIDSEHAKNIQDTYRKVWAVLHSLASPASPVSGFHTGNLETLETTPARLHLDPVQALKVFWETHYCPDRIKVVTVGSESNAEQLKLLEKEFGSVKPQSRACDSPPQSFNVPKPFPPERLQKWVTVQGNLPRSYLWIHWPLPDTISEYASGALDYIEHVLQYSGENSMVRVLKDNLDLASGIEVMFGASSASTDVYLVAQLTKQGRQNPQLILDIIFSYLALLRRDGVHKDLYESLAAMQKLKWNWGGQESTGTKTAYKLAQRMTRVKPQDLLWADKLIQKPDVKLVQSLMDMLTPTNMNVAFVKEADLAKDSQTAGDQIYLHQAKEGLAEGDSSEFGRDEMKTLPFFGTKYKVQDISDVPDDILKSGSTEKWTSWLSRDVNAMSIEKSVEQSIKAMQVKSIPHAVVVPECPQKVEGIPQSLSVKHMHAAHVPYSSKVVIDDLLYGSPPKKLSSPSTSMDIWHRAGWMTPSPKVQLSFAIRPLKTANEPELSAYQNVQLELYGRLLSEDLAPKMVDLAETGMSYEIKVGEHGLFISFVGFEPGMKTFMAKVLSEIKSFNKDPHSTPELRWNRVRDGLVEDLTTYANLPTNYAIGDRNLLITRGPHSRAELADVLQKNEVTLEKSSTSVSELLLSRKWRLTALAMGNMDQDEASSMVDGFYGGLKDGPLGVAEADATVQTVTPIVNINGPVEVRKLNPRAGDKNDVVVVSVVSGVSTVESRVLLGLLSAIFRPMAYEQLRTKEQLGYIVSAGVVLLSNVHLLSCVVQGEKLNADGMEAAVHHLILNLMPNRLDKMQDKEFEAYKNSFREQLLQPPATLKDEFSHFKGPVHQDGIGFDLLNEMLRYLEGPMVTKDTLKTEWQKLMFPKQGERKVVTIKYFAKGDAQAPRSLGQARQTWVEHNISKDARALLEREFISTTHLTKVDAEERHKLAKAGGWFAMDHHVKLQDEKSASKKPIHVPKQLMNIVEARKDTTKSSALLQNKERAFVYKTTRLRSFGAARQSTLRSLVLTPDA